VKQKEVTDFPAAVSRRTEAELSRRIGITALVLLTSFTGVSYKLYSLQVKRSVELTMRAEKMRKGTQTLHAPRGNIYDRYHNLLAYERQIHEIVADTNHLADIKQVLPRLARVKQKRMTQLSAEMKPEQILSDYRQYLCGRFAQKLGLSVADMDRKLQRLSKEDRVAPVLATELETAQFREWEQLLDEPGVTGLSARSRPKRVYPEKEHLIQLLGTVNYEGKAIDGIEKLVDEQLRGLNGSENLEKASGGRFLPGFDDYQRSPAKPGQNAYLTVDLKIQHMLEEKLHGYFKRNSPKKMACVMMEPKTGSIIAMASEPVYQPLASGGVECRNICITDCFDPGSTMKIITLAAALDTGAVNMGNYFNCNQGLYNNPDLQFNIRDDHPLGTVSVSDIFINSSNIGAYKIARQLGAERFYQYIKRFGFGEKTALPLPRQSAGLLPKLENWLPISLSRIAMGYENSATPLQVAMMVGAIANQGVLMKPRLVTHFQDARGPLTEVKPDAVRQACSASTARKVTQMMEGVVTKGTGKLAAIPDVRVAGKTGTAQLRVRNAHGKLEYSQSHRLVWFAGFAPADNPKVVCVVLAEDPQLADKGMLYGGKYAAPIFADIVSTALNQMAVRELPPALAVSSAATP
jgi:cell division protein FtsI/penicillin-binding protein 2